MVLLLGIGCRSRATTNAVPEPPWEPAEHLSAYGLFLGNGSTQEPAQGVLPYDLNTPFFSDYATKYRFIRVPPGTSAAYHDTDVFAFPVGTIIAKSFAFQGDLADPKSVRRLIETRLLIHRPEGWIGLPYIWNEEQTEAALRPVGGTRDVSFRHADGRERSFNYIIPNVNQCRNCHENDKIMQPLGPKARNLNKDFAYGDGRENQLTRWTSAGYLQGAPPPEQAPRAAVWNDPATGSVDQRARTWLDVNCAHCHNPNGPGKLTGLDLRLSQTDKYRWGAWKTPTSAGRATGGGAFDIVPGKPDASILLHRIRSTDPAVMMPELTRRLADEEGAALIREWIAGM